MLKPILVEDYNPQWAEWFQDLRSKIWPVVKDHAISMQHVGSTSVPGLAAKPVLDIDIVIDDPKKLYSVIQGLETLGYVHRGNLGIEGREAFRAPADSIKHHLYVCLKSSASLKNHITLRNHLLLNPEDRAQYGELKKTLAQTSTSMDEYIDGKTSFIVGILSKYITDKKVLSAITAANGALPFRRLVVKSDTQTAELWDENKVLKTYKISTAAKGLSCEPGTNCTPTGILRVASKIGALAEPGTVFKGRVPTGDVWSNDPENLLASSEDDLILTRILWLEGAEEKNANTFKRFIYLHGTNQETLLGTPASHGCIRFSNADIIEIFDQLPAGSIVEIS